MTIESTNDKLPNTPAITYSECYVQPFFTFYNADNMAIMKTFKDKEFDLAIVDPPYGINADNKNNGKNSDSHEKTSKAKINTYKKTNWDNAIPNEEYFEELKRISKRQIIWGANYFGLVGGMLYWHKNVTMPTYSTGELAYLSWLQKIDFVNITWHGMLQQNMKNKEERIHPTQKPIQLYEWLLNNYANENDKILDTHLGSGSIAIAIDKANTLDKKNLTFVGIELDPEYYRAAVERFKNHKRQCVLF
jgi:site-specific DNA-methyltransferase (adenine-specific)